MQQKINLVISDVDGTLIDGGLDGIPSIKSINTVKKLKNLGIYFCCATGRSITEMKIVIEKLKLNSYLILDGGAKIYDLQNNKYVWEKFIEKNAVNEILKYIKEDNLEYVVSEQGKGFNSKGKINTDKINSIVIFNLTKEKQQHIYSKLKLINNIHISNPLTSAENKSDYLLQINHIQATKQYAVFELLKILSINRENCLGIGDGENDIPLLSACGIKVAMGNASESLKQIADYVTSPVWEDGFSYAIDKFVFDQRPTTID